MRHSSDVRGVLLSARLASTILQFSFFRPNLGVRCATTYRFHTHRTAGGHRHHCGSYRVAAAGCAAGTGSGSPHPVQEQSQADWSRDSQFPRHPQRHSSADDRLGPNDGLWSDLAVRRSDEHVESLQRRQCRHRACGR